MATPKKAARKVEKRKKLTDKATAAGHGRAADKRSGIVTIDRRSGGDRRGSAERRHQDGPVPDERRQLQRRAKVNRRRQIDPTTCERDYTDDEIEFMNALDDYKRRSGRMFPTCSEVLEVIRALGYEKRSPESPITEPTGAASAV